MTAAAVTKTPSAYHEYAGEWGAPARLAWDTIAGRPTAGIPSWLLHPMEHSVIEALAARPPGSYRQDPIGVYLAMQRAIGTCLIDQWIPENPLSMGEHGFEQDATRGPTAGAEAIVVDGIRIDSPEAVVEHLERVVFPRLEEEAGRQQDGLDDEVGRIIAQEGAVQRLFGPDFLKAPYRFRFPGLHYWDYGYESYFMAYALYPEVMERDFRLQAQVCRIRNVAIARAIRQGGLPPLLRLDHDMADGRGTLVDVRSLDRIWFPYFAAAIQPLLDAGIRLLWHCDGNLMAMVPRLIEAGVSGFQGFQYEFGMDYPAICRMRDREGSPLLIIAGASVTTTLVHGSPDDVRRELRWLVEEAGESRLFLGGSSSIVPGTPLANIRALVEGMRYYQEHRA